MTGLSMTDQADKQKKSLAKPVLLVAGIVLLMILAKVFHVDQRIGDLREWIVSLGILGPVVYFVIYVAAVVLAVPGALISVLAGVLFGSLLGMILVSLASTLGAGLAFLIARHWARASLEARFAGNPAIQRLERLSEEHGAIIVAITRLVPIFPFNLLNYGFGLTRVSFRTYFFWSWLCMLPGTVLYVVGADTLTSAVSEGRIPWPLIGILAGVLVLMIFLTGFARKRLRSGENRGKQNGS
jgi:uncharacterized membrane protein YdjX (TVP38/TMEM64 family)